MLTRRKLQTSILLVIGILIMLNVIGNEVFFRLDFTADQRYTLSDATNDILDNLSDPITITAYFSEDLPPDVARVREDFREMLVEYNSNSGGQIVYEFINPNKDEQTEAQAQQSGIRPIMINVRERDQVKQQRAYLGALVQFGEDKEVIPFIQPGAAMEYALSSSIKKLTVADKPKLGFLQGNGEPSLAALQQLRISLNIMYEVDTLTIGPGGISPEYKTVVIIAPRDTIPDGYTKHLDDFLALGGRLLLAINNVEGDLQASQGKEIYTGLADWLKEKGVEVEKNFLIDINCSNVMVRQQQGMFVMNTPVSFPYLPVITNFTDHPITKGLESVVLPFASSIRINPADTSLVYIPLALSSEKSGIQNLPLFFDISRQWVPSDYPLSSVPVAVAVEGNIVGNMNSKMVVFSDGDFVINGEGQQAQQLQPDNISLMVNAIDWLSDDTGLIELRTKGVTSRPLDASIEEGTKRMVKYLNFLLPIILIILYGIYRYQKNRKIRNKLKSIDYVR